MLQSTLETAYAYRGLLIFVPVIALFLHRMVIKPWLLYRALLKAGIPMAPRNFPFGQLPEIMRNRFRLEELRNGYRKKYGNYYVTFIGPLPLLNCTDPEVIKQILITNRKCYQIAPVVKALMTAVFGKEHLIGLQGEDHKAFRKQFSPMLYFERMQKIGEISRVKVSKMLSDFEARENADHRISLNIFKDMKVLGGEILGHFTFGFETQADPACANVQAAAEVLHGLMDKFALFGKLPCPSFWIRLILRKEAAAAAAARTIILKSVDKQIESYKDADETNDDGTMIHYIMRSYNESQSLKSDYRMDMQAAKNTINMMYIGGFNTIPTVTSITLYFLAKNPTWQDNLRTAITKACPNGEITVEDVKKIELLTMVINESMRLQPLAQGIARQSIKEHQMIGYEIPAGITVRMLARPVHLDKELWGEDALEFNPKRFENGISKAAKHPNAFVPFGGGDRMCLGRSVAMMEIGLIVSMVLQKYKISLQDGYKFDTGSSSSVFSFGPTGVQVNLDRVV